MRVLTLTGGATLPQARVLAASLRRHQPDWPHEIVVIDRAPVSGDGTPLRSAADQLGIDLTPLIALHDELELRRLLSAPLLARELRPGGEPVLLLPPTAWVLAPLDPVAEALTRRSVMLTPRVLADPPDDGLQPAYEHLERAGRISDGVIGVADAALARGFLDWWGSRVAATLGSLDGRPSRMRPEDRPWLNRFLELAPARFAAAVLDDPGCNLSFWNLPEHVLSAGEDGPLSDGRPLRFLDLPGFRPDRPYRLNELAGRVRVSRSPVLRELCIAYVAELEREGWRDTERRADEGSRLPGGLVFDEALRRVYARALRLGESFGEIFETAGAEAFLAWLDGPAPAGAAHGINRYLYYRVAGERPDVLRAYPDLDGPDGDGFIAWCAAFGRNELGLAPRFLGEGESAPPPVRRPAARRGGEAQTPGAAPAVRVTGFLGHSLGLGAAARGYAAALDAAGVPVSTRSVPLHHLALPAELDDDYGRHSFEGLVHEGRHGYELVAVNADELPSFVARLGPGGFEGPRIGIWGWETNAIPARWQEAFSLVEEIWVYSRFMAENLGAAAPVPVVALPPPVPVPPEPAAPLRLEVPDGFLFLFVFDYLSTIERKNPVGLVEAFKHAFAPGEGPQLLVKTINAPLRPLAEEAVLWAAHGREDVHVIDRSLDGEGLAGLMAACDCYASLHRSEGFGLTMAEAMALGKPVIATGYSGNVDFMDDENSFLVRSTPSRVGPDSEIYPAEGEWAEPDIEDAARLMREVVEHPERAAVAGARAKERIERTLSPQATGAAMRARLEELEARGV